MPEEATTADPAGEAPTEKTFTQAELDAKIADRLSRERKKFADYDEVKAKAAEFEQLKQAQMSDLERTAAEAEARGRSAVLAEVGERLARTEFRAAAATAGIDVADVLEYVDVRKFVGDDGEPDTKAIDAAVGKFAAVRAPEEPQEPGMPSFDGGPRGPQQTALNGDPLLRDLKKHLGIR